MSVASTTEAAWYDARLEDPADPQYGEFWELDMELYRRAADLIAGQCWPPVVELGCGTGRFAHYLLLRHPELEYTGLDFSARAVAEAERYTPELASRFRTADLRADFVTWKGEAAVVALELLEHLEDDTGLLKWLRGSAGTAYVIASVPSYDSAAHLRTFLNAGDVLRRYQPWIDYDELERIPVGQRECFWLFAGRLR